MSPRLATAILAIALLVPGLSQANPLAGTWRAAQGGQSVEITLEADGRFARQDRGPDGTAMTVSGHWTLANAGPWLRLTIEDWAPRRACGLLGCTPIRMLPGETYRYVLQPDGTLLLEDTGGRIALRRGD
ncbi:hypothetical protein [Roseomonas rosulenta]|uniref:hypothetical protein n=1 Tax=Roseomonas rosulenta TaxID=2748667 RepID=UPI0018E00337|nr:hypothetical protein [Roseomonas rosulenta]